MDTAEILAEATSRPWAWREDEFRSKYMIRMRNGKWRMKAGERRRSPWVFLLTGPKRSGVADELVDEFDYRHVLALRWSCVRGATFVGGPTEPDAALIVLAVNAYERDQQLIGVMVEALKYARRRLDHEGGCDQGYVSANLLCTCGYGLVEEALARVRGEEV